MAAEEITKFAINSTLGTSDFQPLDKIITSQRSLAPSDTVIVVLHEGAFSVSTNTTKEITSTFKALKNGSVRIICNGYIESSSGSLEICVTGTNGSKYYASTSETKNIDFTVDIPIVENVTYSFSFYASNSFGWVQSVKIGAQIVDTSLIEYTL